MAQVLDKLSEDECYLWALISDLSGLDTGEFCVADETNDKPDDPSKPEEAKGKDGTYCFRAWPFQWPWWRNMADRQIEQGSRSSGKSMSIRFRALAFPIVHPGDEMVITAPEGVHLDAITDVIETMFLNNPFPAALLVKGRQGFKHRPFHANFQNGARIMGRIPQRDGRGIKGTHPVWLELDEGQDYPPAGWDEVIETLKQGAPGAQWRVHGVTRGMQDKFWKYTQPDQGWEVHHYPAMYRPTWTAKERKEKIELYGSVDSPDYRRNILGLHGDAMSPLFVLHRLMKCMDEDTTDDYNAQDYYQVKLDEGTLAYYDGKIENVIAPPLSHLEDYSNFWVGMDIGFTTDPSVIVVFAEEKKGPKSPSKLRLLVKATLNRVGAPEQADAVLHLVDRYRPHAFTCDATGLGLPMFQIFQYWAQNRENPNYEEAQRLLKSIKGYNFSSKIVVEYDSTTEVDVNDRDGLEKQEVKRVVKEYATDVLRGLVDDQRLILPKDTDLIGEFQGQSWTYHKDALDQYGRKKSYSDGYFHTLDACRMAVLGWKQHEIDTFREDRKNKFVPMDTLFIQ